MEKFDETRFYQEYAARPDQAFRMLMDGFRDKLFVFCSRAARSKMDAEEMTQDVFIRVWKGLPQFRRDSSLNTWIYHIAWNVCASYIQNKGAHPDNASYDEVEDEDSPSFRFAVNDERVDRFEKRQYLDRLFEELPFNHKIVLTLYFYQEQSYEEIAKITGWPLGTVKATLHRAKGTLREAAKKLDSHGSSRRAPFYRPPAATNIGPGPQWENIV